MGTTPTLVHHAGPTYTLHSHPLAAYGMMRPVATPLTMQPTLGGGKGHPTAYSNDLGPPIFMPCKFTNGVHAVSMLHTLNAER